MRRFQDDLLDWAADEGAAFQSVATLLDGYCRFFFGGLGGCATQPETIRQVARRQTGLTPARIPTEPNFNASLVPAVEYVH